MKKITFLILCLGFSISAVAQSKVLDLSFLLGTWELKTDKGTTLESWTKIDNKLTGKSYQINLKGERILLETVEIKDIDGRLFFCVTGAGHQDTVNFKLIPSAAGELRFENMDNEFPQRIIYQNKGKDKLFAWIEGTFNGKETKIEFPYQRKK